MGEPPSLDLQRRRMLVELCKHLCAVEVILARLERIEAADHPHRGFNQRQALTALQGANDYALITHLARTLDWLGLVKQHFEVIRGGGRKLTALSQAIRLLRNKREHSHAFLDPQKIRPFLAMEQVGPSAFMATPPDWSSSIKGVRRLGGRLAVRDIGPAVHELRDEIIAADLWVLNVDAADMIVAEAQLYAPNPLAKK